MNQQLQVVGRVLGNPDLRRVEAAFLAFGTAEYGVWVAVLVYAFERGGTGLAAAIAVVQLMPAAVVAPAAAQLVDRRGGASILRASYLLQSLTLLATGTVFLAGGPPPLGYACAILAASAVTLTRPAQGALLPQLVRAPSELTAANAASSWVESATFLTGPALSGLLIGLDGPGASVLAFGLLMAGAGALVARLHRLGDASASTTAEDPTGGGLRDVLAGTRELRALLALLVAEFVVEGAIDVLVVVLAIRRLGLGTSGPGYLDSMFGVGAVLGGAGAVVLIGRRRMTRPLLLAALVWGSSFVALGAWRSAVGSFGLLAVAGASRTVLEAAGRTMLHRAVAPGVHGRIFGALEGLSMVGLAAGSLSVPLLVDLGGIEAASAAAGGLLVAVAIAVARAVRRLDAGAGVSESAIALLRGSDIFAGLDGPGVEDLARALAPLSLCAGEVVVAEGESGDRFYLIETGVVAITIAGAPVRTLGPGAGFGEIALLRDGVRTATATATGAVELQALHREPFLQALSRCAPAARAAEEVVHARVGLASSE